jgi:hypothetical protein
MAKKGELERNQSPREDTMGRGKFMKPFEKKKGWRC